MKLDSTLSAVVTGGASGLGAATARMLAAEGVKVTLFDRNAGQGEEVAAEIGGVFADVDVTDQTSVEAGFEKARAATARSGSWSIARVLRRWRRRRLAANLTRWTCSRR